jgi:hypothetical protein
VTRSAVLVVGPHRSGTSATAAVCDALLGAGLEASPRPGNARGQYERADLRPHLTRLLHSRSSSWQSPPEPPLTSRDPTWWWQLRFRRAIATEGRDHPLLWKDPRLCLTLAPILSGLARAGWGVRVVHVVRDPRAAAASLAARDHVDPADALRLWWAYERACLDALAGHEAFVIDADRLVAIPDLTTAALAGWLHVGRDRVAGAASRVVAADLHRHAVSPSVDTLAAAAVELHAGVAPHHGTAITFGDDVRDR